MDSKKPINGFIGRALKALREEFVIVKNDSVKTWEAWLILGVIAGVVAGVFYVANREGRFLASRADLQCVAYTTIQYYDVDPDFYTESYVCDSDWGLPIYCVDYTYCSSYADVTPTIYPTTAPSPDDIASSIEIDPVAYDGGIGVDVEPGVIIDDPINLDGDWSEFGTDFIEAASAAADPFLEICQDCQEEATEDYVHNNFHDEKIADEEGEVTVLSNAGQFPQLEEGAIKGACEQSDCAQAIIDDAIGLNDDQAELFSRADLPKLDLPYEARVDLVPGPNIEVASDISMEQATAKAAWQRLTDGLGDAGFFEQFGEKFAGAFGEDDVLSIIFVNDYKAFMKYVYDIKYEYYLSNGYSAADADLKAYDDQIRLADAAGVCFCKLLGGALSDEIILMNLGNTKDAIETLAHEYYHAYAANEKYDPLALNILNQAINTGLFDQIYLNGSKLPYVSVQLNEFFATVFGTLIANQNAYPSYITPGSARGNVYALAATWLTNHGYYSNGSSSHIQLKNRFTDAANIPAQAKNFLGGFDFKNLLAGLFDLVTKASAAAIPNETQIAFDKTQKMSDTLKTISDQAGQVAEQQVTAAINAIVPGVDQWFDLGVADFGAHRYWRFLDTGGSSKLQISEIAMSEFSIANLAPLSGTTIYFAPGTLPDLTAMNNAFDGDTQNLATLASSAGVTYIGRDFGAPRRIGGVSLYEHGNSYGFNAKLQYSDDKTNWSDANIAVNIPVASKNAANISFAKNVAPETAKMKNRAFGFSRLTPIYGEMRDSLTTGKAPDGKSAMTKDFEVLLKGSLNAADARKEARFANTSQDTTVLPFTSLTGALQYSAVVMSKHTSLSSALVQQDILASAVAGSKAKQKSDLGVLRNDLVGIVTQAELLWDGANTAFSDAKAAKNEIDKILNNAPPELKAQLQAIDDEASLNLEKTKDAYNLAKIYISKVRNADGVVRHQFNNATDLNAAISKQAHSISEKTQVMMYREELLLNAANSQLAVAAGNTTNAINSTSASTQRKQLSKAAATAQATAKRLDGVFLSTSEPLYTQYANLASASASLASKKSAFKNSLDAWQSSVDITKAKEQKPKAEAASESLKTSTADAKTYAQKVKDNLTAAKALMP